MSKQGICIKALNRRRNGIINRQKACRGYPYLRLKSNVIAHSINLFYSQPFLSAMKRQDQPYEAEPDSKDPHLSKSIPSMNPEHPQDSREKNSNEVPEQEDQDDLQSTKNGEKNIMEDQLHNFFQSVLTKNEDPTVRPITPNLRPPETEVNFFKGPTGSSGDSDQRNNQNQNLSVKNKAQDYDVKGGVVSFQPGPSPIPTSSKLKPGPSLRQISSESKRGPSLESDLGTSQKTQTHCGCKKSQCLKNYCECYKKGKVCGGDCSCLQCQNKNKKIHKEAERANSKFEACTCTKSKCKKKYCECYAQSTRCGPKCRCLGCQNKEESKTQKTTKKEGKYDDRKEEQEKE